MTRPPSEQARKQVAGQAMRDVVPVLLAAAPYGLIVGVAATEAGFGITGALSMSLMLFAGAAQLAAIDLLAHEATVLTAVLAALVINARFVIYGASLAPHLRQESRPRRAMGAYLLTDHAYSVAITRFNSTSERKDPWTYYFTVGTSVWAVWQLATVVGASLGDVIPDQVPLSFSAPLVFLALLVPTIRNRRHLFAAVVAGTSAVALTPLTGNASLLTSSTLGVVAGWALVSRSWRACS